MFINTFRYTPEDVDCRLCTAFTRKDGCTAPRCLYLAERIEAGVVGYDELLPYAKAEKAVSCAV